MSDDLIYIRDLRVETIIGLFEWERRIPQLLVLDLAMATDIRKAAASDDIADTLDYKSVAKRVLAHVKESQFKLVESLAESIAELIIREFSVPWLKLEVNKTGALRGARDVGVIIERSAEDYSNTAARKSKKDQPSTLAWISIGSNQQPEKHIARALVALEKRFGPLRSSAVYQNPAVGFDGPDFLNLVVGFETQENADRVNQALRSVEDENGRDRSGPRFSDRSIDLDLILFGDEVSANDGLVLPRPEVLTQAFVLTPLADIFPDGTHPVTGDSYANLAARLDQTCMRRLDSAKTVAAAGKDAL